MHRAVLISLGVIGLLVACGEASHDVSSENESPSTASQPVFKLDPRDEGFRFGPTFTVHRPSGSELIPLVEVGVADRRMMHAVVAYADVQGPAVGLWRFEMGGEKDTLMPSSAPTPLLAIRPGDPIDEAVLNEFRTNMGAGHAVVTHPQGLEPTAATDALDVLNKAARSVLDADAPIGERVQALARFVRGLDEDLLLSRAGLATALHTMQTPTRVPEPPNAAQRRVTFVRDGQQISMLRKTNGWVISAIESIR